MRATLRYHKNMSTVPLIPQKMSVDEYLRTSFDGPDLEYLDGELVERNMGNLSHSRVQAVLASLLMAEEHRTGLFVVTELRGRVSPNRYRIPDVSVFASRPAEQVPAHPPLVAIEILSPDDRIGYVIPKLVELQRWGVENIWIVDPDDRKLFVYSESGLNEVTSLELPAHDISISASALFR